MCVCVGGGGVQAELTEQTTGPKQQLYFSLFSPQLILQKGFNGLF